jgi:peroxiredoxin
MRSFLVSSIVVFSACCVMAADPAADFTLKDLAGQDVSLSSYKGKIVVIDFWATWCAACKEAFGNLNKIQKEMANAGVVVIGIDLEKMNPQKVAAFVQKVGIEYTVVLDPAMATAKLYGVKGVPSLVVIDKEQNVVKMFRGMNASTEKEIAALLGRLSGGQ